MALAHFLAKIERRAFLMARIATGNNDDALDLVQDAMLQLTRNYSRRRPQEWPPLFHRILQSRIRDWYRRSRVRNRWRSWILARDDKDAENPIDTVADNHNPGPGEQTIIRQALTALEQALQTLPLRQQQAFLLRAWEEFDVTQTAQAMGCSVGSVKTHYSRAVHTLRKLLEDHS